MIQNLLEERASSNIGVRFSGFQFAVIQSGNLVASGHGGQLSADPASEKVTAESVFDLASVTKLYTATLASLLHDSGEIDLDSPLCDWVEVSPALSQITSRELLTHVSGLPPWWEEQSTRAKTLSELFSLEPSSGQRGEIVYSCTGYSMYAMSLERKYGTTFDKLLRARLLDPLGLSSTIFNPPSDEFTVVVAREPDEDVPLGLVHDPRARALEGISGNAGLFANAMQVAAFLDQLASSDVSIVTEGVREQLFTPTAQSEWEQAIGFRHRDRERLGAASDFFSHSGFTGTLAMVHPEKKVSGVLLTNRLQHRTSREELAEVYREFAEGVGEFFG